MITRSSQDHRHIIIVSAAAISYALGLLHPSGEAIVEAIMKKLIALVAVATVNFASAAVAHHAENLDIPFPTRGECQAKTSALSNDDYWLIDAFPDLFSSEGEVRSFLNRAFTCERNESDGNFYITDHRLQVLDSDWFERRQR